MVRKIKTYLSSFTVCSNFCVSALDVTWTHHKSFSEDEVAEWLRRWTANPMCSARVGSNPILIGKNFTFRPRNTLGLNHFYKLFD